MFESFDSIRGAISGSQGEGDAPLSRRKFRRRKDPGERLAFYGLNGIVLPLVGLCYLTVSAEGLRQCMDVFQMKLYRLPAPGAGLMQNYDGFDRLDLALPMALVLFIALSMLWKRVFQLLQDPGNLKRLKSDNPILFYLLSGIFIVTVLGDSGLFYAGLSSNLSSWDEDAGSVPTLVCVVIYSAGIALLGAWHADYYKTESL